MRERSAMLPKSPMPLAPKVTPDAGLLAYRELDAALGLGNVSNNCMATLLLSIPKTFRAKFWFLIFLSLFAVADSSLGSDVALADFSLKIGANRKTVLLLEPVVFQASLTNHSDKPLIVKHLLSQSAAAFVYQVRGTNESWQDLEKSVRSDWRDCGNDLETNRAWGIYAHATLPDIAWIPNGFPAGSYKFRVVFRILAGENSGSEIASDEIKIMVFNPTGTNKTAYDFWKSGHTFSAPWVIGNQLVGWRLQAYPSFLIPNSGSHLRRPEHDFFLQNCSNSAYADYVRYTMTTYLNIDEKDRPLYELRLREIVDHAPVDFPMLGNAYGMLFAHYQQRHELEKMAALSRQFQEKQPEIYDSDLAKYIADRIKEIGWWPPKTQQEREIAQEAALTLRTRALSEKHWLAKDLEAVYGVPRQSSEESHYAKKWFYNPKSSWFDTTEFFYASGDEPEKIVFHGSLETFCVGKLGGILARIKRIYSLDAEKALGVFIEATVEGDQISGYVTFPDKTVKPFDAIVSSPPAPRQVNANP